LFSSFLPAGRNRMGCCSPRFEKSSLRAPPAEGFLFCQDSLFLPGRTPACSETRLAGLAGPEKTGRTGRAYDKGHAFVLFSSAWEAGRGSEQTAPFMVVWKAEDDRELAACRWCRPRMIVSPRAAERGRSFGSSVYVDTLEGSQGLDTTYLVLRSSEGR
jgi:hypothetical protein